MRGRCIRGLFWILFLAGFGQWRVRSHEYLNDETLAARLRELARTHSEFIVLENLKNDAEARDFWRVELGAGGEDERRKRPAMLLAAGIEGNDLAGTTTAVAWIESIASRYATNPNVKTLLDQATIYVFPRVNSSAAALFFARPKVESLVNPTPVDEDHDGLVDEDGPEDLNGDGLITWMRVEDAEGEFIEDPADSRLMIRADKAKGERGRWRYLIEGRDNDADEAWNEDGPGGVNYNRNFPYNYSYFGPAAGPHPVSEERSRLLADFVVDHPNIALAFTFGAADNLAQTPKAEEPPARKPQNEIHKDDLPIYRELGKLYRDSIGLKKELAVIKQPGSFSDWVYFHRGRLSLAARPWSPALQVALAPGAEKPKETDEGKRSADAKKDEQPGEKPKSSEKTAGKTADEEKRNEEDRAFLKWIDENSKESFIPWTAFEHPDFPGQKTEIGGFAPFARSNPPRKVLDELIPKQIQFLDDLLGKLPRLKIQKAVAKPLGNSVYELKVAVENAGYLPAALAQGKYTREVYPTRLELKLDDSLILGGARITTIDSLEGSGGRSERRYIVHAPDRTVIELEAVSMLGGIVKTNLELSPAR